MKMQHLLDQILKSQSNNFEKSSPIQHLVNQASKNTICNESKSGGIVDVNSENGIENQDIENMTRKYR